MDWLTALGQAFSYFGGVSEMVVPDNPRALIAHPDCYEPGLNRAALECARHYDTVKLPARLFADSQSQDSSVSSDSLSAMGKSIPIKSTTPSTWRLLP